MKRKGQIDLWMRVQELDQGWDYANRRDIDTPLGHANESGVRQQLQGVEYLGIRQRLPHSHYRDGGNRICRTVTCDGILSIMCADETEGVLCPLNSQRICKK